MSGAPLTDADSYADPSPRDAVPFAIDCRDVTKRFQVFSEGNAWRVIFGAELRGESIEAIGGISLSIPKGTLVGVLGRNGAGKSTLLRILGGVYAPTSGIVRIEGEIASLFELGGMGNRFITGREYAERILRLQGVSGTQLQEYMVDIEDFSELGEFFERRIYTYSSGMAARLYFAVATAKQQDVYLIDEVLSVGDEHFQSKCWHRMKDRLAEGASGILVTHDWSAVIKLCARSHVLDKGMIVDCGDSDKVVAKYLDIPKPDPNTAVFLDLPEALSVGTGQNWTFEVDVHVKRGAEVEFAFSIEVLWLGVGWEIMLLSDFKQVGSSPGKFRVSIEIPYLPLAPGKYSLNLFLRALDGASNETIACDVRSWTTGNAVALNVTGNPLPTIANLALDWSEIPANAAH